MDLIYIVSIIILVLTIIILLFKINSIVKSYNEENFNLKENFLKQKEEVYELGLKKGKELINYQIEIHPYQEIKQNKKYFGNEDVINIGYKYMMFINGVPTAYTHIEIFETISKKEINEDKVNNLLNQISNVTSLIPGGNVKLIGSLAEFGKNLLNQKK